MAEESQTYKIWGIDNVVYGPVELPTLVTWVKEERVTAGTWVYVDGGDLWQKASQLPELAIFFNRGGAPRPLTSTDTEVLSRAANVEPGTLRQIKVFAGFNDEQLARFVRYMEFHEASPFATVVKQGDPGDAMYLILNGEVRVRMIIGGKETTLTTLGRGDFFGEISLFDHGPRSADVVANQESLLLRITASAFQQVIEKAPDLAAPFLLAVGKTLTARIRADNKRFRDTIAMARNAID